MPSASTRSQSSTGSSKVLPPAGPAAPGSNPCSLSKSAILAPAPDVPSLKSPPQGCFLTLQRVKVAHFFTYAREETHVR